MTYQLKGSSELRELRHGLDYELRQLQQIAQSNNLKLVNGYGKTQVRGSRRLLIVRGSKVVARFDQSGQAE